MRSTLEQARRSTVDGRRSKEHSVCGGRVFLSRRMVQVQLTAHKQVEGRTRRDQVVGPGPLESDVAYTDESIESI